MLHGAGAKRGLRVTEYTDERMILLTGELEREIKTDLRFPEAVERALQLLREAGDSVSLEAAADQMVSYVVVLRRLVLARAAIDRATDLAREWASRAEPGEWGDTPMDTMVADAGREILTALEGEL